MVGMVLPVFAIIAIGWVASARGWVEGSAAETALMRLAVNVFYPALIFKFVVHNDALRDPSTLLQSLGAGTGGMVLGMFAALLLGAAFGIRRRDGRGCFAVAAGVYNFGFFAIPIARGTFGDEAVGVMLAVNAGVELAIWSVGLLLITGDLSLRKLHRMLSPPVIALLVALPLNYADAQAWLPGPFLVLVDALGECSIPMGLILTGVTFHKLFDESRGELLRSPRIPLAGCVIRLLILPSLILLAAITLPLSTEVRQVLYVHSAMPSAVFPVVLARHYGGNGTVALKVSLTTNLAALVTIPLWLTLTYPLLWS